MDPIANMFAQIKNAARAARAEVEIPYAKTKLAILDIFKKQGFIEDFEEMKVEDQKYPAGIKVVLKYKNKTKEPVINDIKRVSRPGRRVYLSSTRIPMIHQGKTDILVSTSQGIMSGKDARKKGLGGEVICEVK